MDQVNRTINDFPPGLVAVLSASMARYARFAAHLAVMERPEGSALTWKHEGPIQINANQAVWDMLDVSAYQWIFLLNDDHTPEQGLLGSLLASMFDENRQRTGRDVISAFYLERQAPFVPILRKARGHELKLWEDMKPVTMGDRSVPMFPEKPELMPAFECGSGGLLIHRSVFHVVEHPWFDFMYVGEPRKPIGEDIYFARKCRQKGIQVWVDTRQTYGHIMEAVVRPVWLQRADGSWYQGIELNLGRGFLLTMTYEEFELATRFSDVMMGEPAPRPLEA